MPVTYTNRKGVTYYLCQGKTVSGKPRYYFTPGNEGDLVEQIPEGYTIRENVNGRVSLARARAPLIKPEELALVEAALRQHHRAENYRAQLKGKQIEVYERASANPKVITDSLKAANHAQARY